MTCAPYNFGRRETGCEPGMLIYGQALNIVEGGQTVAEPSMELIIIRC